MKHFIVLISLLAISQALAAQMSLDPHMIDGNAASPVSVFAADIDLDGDIDIVSALYDSHSIVWWENSGDNQTWNKHTIGTNFLQAGCVVVADLDGDDLPDVIGSARNGHQVAWWRNKGGNPIQWEKQVIRNNYTYAHEVKAYDLDQDGDMDVIGCSSDLHLISWWRNDGGSPISWTEFTIGEDVSMAKSIDIGDFDSDGKPDVVGAALFSHDVILFRNLGGNPIRWERSLIDDDFNGAHRVEAVDIDLDGVLDVVGAGYMGGQIAWWKNEGGTPIKWTRQIIARNFWDACIATAGDLDKDGDIDVVGTSQKNGQVAWWENENDGHGHFQWTQHLIDNLPKTWPVFIIDMDQDEDLDVVAGSGKGGGNRDLKWYENSSSTTKNSLYETPFDIKLFPNPNHGRFMLVLPDNFTDNITLSLFTLQGKLIWTNEIRSTGITHHAIEFKEEIKGVYILLAENSKQRSCQRILIQ